MLDFKTEVYPMFDNVFGEDSKPILKKIQQRYAKILNSSKFRRDVQQSDYDCFEDFSVSLNRDVLTVDLDVVQKAYGDSYGSDFTISGTLDYIVKEGEMSVRFEPYYKFTETLPDYAEKLLGMKKHKNSSYYGYSIFSKEDSLTDFLHELALDRKGRNSRGYKVYYHLWNSQVLFFKKIIINVHCWYD